MRALPSSARLYLVGLWCVALAVVIGATVSSWHVPLPVELLAALIFTVLLTVADLTAFEMASGRLVSVAVAVLIAALTSLTWPLLFVAIVVGTVAGALARDQDWWQVASAVSVRCLAAAAGKLLVDRTRGSWAIEDQVGTLPYTTVLSIAALLLAGGLFYLIERGAVAGLARLGEGKPLREGMRLREGELRWYVLLLAPLGGLLAILWDINGIAVLLGIVPMVLFLNALRSQSEVIRVNNEMRGVMAAATALSSKLERLQSLMIALITIRDAPTMLQMLVDRLAELMSAANGWVVLLDDQQVPTLVAAHNLPVAVDGFTPAPVPLPKSYEAVLGRQRVMMFTDQHIQTLAPVPQLTHGVYWNALVCIPLVDEKRVMGAICLTFAEIRGLNEDEQRVLMAFARQAATVIANARLFRKVQESQAELIQSSKLAAVGTFAAGIAHEFNNLLGGMLGYAQLGLASPEDETKNESLKVVVDTCKRGKSITGSLLTFARRQEPRRELADLYDAINGTLVLMEIELRKHHVQVVRDINPVPLTICDAGQISQVFLNLLTNARDAMKPRGGTLSVSLDGDERGITLTVRDTGHGIPEAIRDKIFEPFFTTKGALGGSATPGTGLGLSVSYGIVKSHGGSFDVRSEAGKGTTMTIWLPVIETPEAAAALAEAEREPAELPSLRILLADDDVTIQRSLKRLLEQIGHTVSAYGDGQGALDAYKAGEFDIVLSDLAMPGMGGLELLRELRAYDADARVLILTGQTTGAQQHEALRLGAAEILRKPFELEEVLRAIRAVYMRRAAPVVR
ncbi:MAG TPA: response regulator [Chloroflexaceae bacterium]|nr:response regulator [Chloroflexaceae bacterium]